MNNDSNKKVVNEMLAGNKVLLITHKRPDADALGSLTTIYKWLNDGKRQLDLFSSEPETVNEYSNVFTFKDADLKKDVAVIKDTFYDRIIILDCGSLSQADIGDWIEEYKNKYPKTVIVNIDHHLSNDYYGHINYVNPSASSTCQLVYELLRSQQQTISAFMATSLLYGIIADTGSFSNGATNLESLKISSELLQLGARHYQVSHAYLSNKETNLLRLWGVALSRLVLLPDQKIAYTYITKEDLALFAVNGSEGLSNFLNSLNDADVIMVLTEKDDGTLRGSLRTTKDNIDVMKIAGLFGGGGHKKAAGFSYNGGVEKIDEIINTIINNLII